MSLSPLCGANKSARAGYRHNKDPNRVDRLLFFLFFCSALTLSQKTQKKKSSQKTRLLSHTHKTKRKNSRLHRTSSWGCYVSSLKPQASAKSVTVQKLPAHRTYPSRTGLSVTKTRHLQLIGRSRAPLRHSL